MQGARFWVICVECALNLMSMRIPIIAFLTLAALAGGELGARAIDPSAAPTEAEFREGTAEAQGAQREEDEVIGDNLTSNRLSLLFVAKSRSPLNKGGTR